MRLLIAEDEAEMSRALCAVLKHNNYSVDAVYNGNDALNWGCSENYDGIILDIMMPKRDGLSVLHSLRKKGIGTPVLFLTARDAVEDRVLGLDSGADDYLVKPFAFDELIARIRAMTRKSAGNSSNIFSVADLVMDTASHTVTRGGKEIALSAKEFSLLEYLLRNKGHVLSRTMIENNLWNFDYSGGTNAVDVYIRYLRKKVDDGFEPKLIHTVRGCGYVLKENQVLP